MVKENPGWGAPRIHGELKMLGFEISERTVIRWTRKTPRDGESARRWAAFLSNHREAIAAMDFFTVPTLGSGLLYCFFIIHHAERRILQCNVTSHPTAAWVSQQLREAFPYDSAPQFLIFDREHTFEGEVMQTAGSLGIRPVRTAVRNPWQNGIAERWVVLLCYKVGATLKESRYLRAGMVVPCLHERQGWNFRRPAAKADELS
jgi:transposase InsO family protein